MDGLSLIDMKEGTKHKVAPEIYKRTEELENKRRAFLKELQLTKTSLELVFRTENFNDLTGRDDFECTTGSTIAIRVYGLTSS